MYCCEIMCFAKWCSKMSMHNKTGNQFWLCNFISVLSKYHNINSTSRIIKPSAFTAPTTRAENNKSEQGNDHKTHLKGRYKGWTSRMWSNRHLITTASIKLWRIVKMLWAPRHVHRHGSLVWIGICVPKQARFRPTLRAAHRYRSCHSVTHW